MITLDADQIAILSGGATAPIYLVELDYSGVEFLSTNGDINVDGADYLTGDVGVMGMDNWTTASLKLRPTPARVAALTSNGWRNGTARISIVPAARYPQIVEDSYVVDDYGYQGFVVSDPVLLLDGVIVNAALTDVIELSVTHRAFVNKWTPRLRTNNTWANHLPQAGTRFLWEGDNYILESKQ